MAKSIKLINLITNELFILIDKINKEYNIEFVVLEKSNDFGGLWRYRDDGYGVMSFT
jgi:hypothetical protein